MSHYTVESVGVIYTCFCEKFAVPRQPLLAPAAKGVIELEPQFSDPSAVEGLEQVSHIWLTFLFHHNMSHKPGLRVRPPRLGGNEKLGVFASRSPFRPNFIGQSVVKLDAITATSESVKLYVSGVDLVNATPILDIKPYVPYVDSIPDAKNVIATEAPQLLPVNFSEMTSAFFEDYSHPAYLKQLIQQVLAQDPRPAYHQIEDGRQYHAALLDVDVSWSYVKSEAGVRIDVVGLRYQESGKAISPKELLPKG